MVHIIHRYILLGCKYVCGWRVFGFWRGLDESPDTFYTVSHDNMPHSEGLVTCIIGHIGLSSLLP